MSARILPFPPRGDAPPISRIDPLHQEAGLARAIEDCQRVVREAADNRAQLRLLTTGGGHDATASRETTT